MKIKKIVDDIDEVLSDIDYQVIGEKITNRISFADSNECLIHQYKELDEILTLASALEMTSDIKNSEYLLCEILIRMREIRSF